MVNLNNNKKKSLLAALPDSNRVNQLIVDNANDLIAIHRLADLSYEYVNPAVVELLGYSPEELFAKSALEIIHPDDRERVLKKLNKMLPDGKGNDEFRCRKKDGTYICLEVTGTILSREYDDAAVITISRDVTARKLAEEALRRSNEELEKRVQDRTAELAMINQKLINEIEQRQQLEESLTKEKQLITAILNTSDALILISTPDGKIVAINQACEKASGYSAQQVIGQYPWDILLSGRDIDVVKRRYAQLASGESLNTSDNFWINKSGPRRLIKWNNNAIRDEKSKPEYMVSTGIDITEQYEAEAALRQSETYYRTIFENSGTAILIIDKDLNITAANNKTEMLIGYSQQELIGLPFEHFLTAENRAIVWEDRRLGELDPALTPQDYEIECVDRYGGIHNAILTVVKIPHTDNLAISIMDVTDQHRAQAMLKESEARFRALFEKAPVAVVINRKGRTLFANRAYADMFGYHDPSELIGKRVTDRIAPGLRQQIEAKIKNREKGGSLPLWHETDGLRKDGSTFPLMVLANRIPLPDGLANVAFFLDITAQKQAETALQHQLESQTLLLDISRQFGNIIAHNIDAMINLALQRIGEFDQSDRSYVFLLSEDGTVINNSHEWCAEGITPEIVNLQTIPTSSFPWWMSKLKKGESIHIPRIADMPPEAQAEKDILQPQGIQSILVLPMFSEEDLIGFMGLDSVKREHKWSPENIVILESVASIITKGLQRKNYAQALQTSEFYYRTIFENTGAATVIIEEDMTLSMVNEECARLMGYSKGDLVGAKFIDFIHGEQVEMMKEFHTLRRQDQKEVPCKYESKIIDKYGKCKDGLIAVDIIPGTKKSVATIIDLTEFNRIDRALKAISAVNTAMIHAEKEEDLLETVCQRIVEIGGYSLAWVGYVLDTPERKVKPVATAGYDHGFTNKLNIALKDPERSKGPSGTAIRTGKPVVCRNFKTDPNFKPWAKEALLRGYKAGMAVPLRNSNKVYGTLSIYSSEMGVFSSEEEKLLMEMANDLAFAINSLRDRQNIKQVTDDLELSLKKMHRLLLQAVAALGTALDFRDPYTAGHQKKVVQVAVAIAHEMRLPEKQIEGIEVAGNLHDIGKINVPSEILSKPGKLSELELAHIKTHPQAGFEIVKDIEFPWPIAEVLLQHHEHLDGSGYPHGLAGEEILMEARIMAVADVVEAMASHRPYRAALGIEAALDEIEKNKGVLYDSKVVDACLRLFREKGYQLE